MADQLGDVGDNDGQGGSLALEGIVAHEREERFIEEYLSGDYTVVELCERHGISRKTGYKWISRFMAGCELGDRSSRPHRSPKAVPAWLEGAIVRARRPARPSASA